MAVIIKSNDMSWLDSSLVFYDDMKSGIMYSCLKNALKSIEDAASLIDSTTGLTSFSVNETDSDIEKLTEDLRRFVYFCNAIHYEISEFVDNPFSVGMGEVAEQLIAINPSDYKYVKSKIFIFKKYLSLTDLVSATIEDESLKESFEDLCNELDEDEISEELRFSIEEAEFWQEQFIMAEAIDKATDEYFTPELRAAWPTLSEDERKKHVEEFKNILGEIYGGGENMVPKAVKFNASGYGASSPKNYIKINPLFVSAPEGKYSLDKLIDTMTHEMRHRYQRLNTENTDLPETVRTEWSHATVDNKKYYEKYYKSPREEDAKAFAALAQDDD